MTGKKLKAIRVALEGHEGRKVSQLAFGRWLGIGGKDVDVRNYVSQMETGKQAVPERTARLAVMFELFGVPNQFK